MKRVCQRKSGKHCSDIKCVKLYNACLGPGPIKKIYLAVINLEVWDEELSLYKVSWV